MTTPLPPLRADLSLIAEMIEPKSRLLDVGCGDGALLAWLDRHKDVDGRGMELSMEGVNACVSNGLSVIQGDADTDLKDYPSDAFDYVVLSQTLQATRNPHTVLEDMARIGRHAIVSFPNFGHWRVRSSLMFRGRMPVTETLPAQWYNTPNIHLCTVRDFVELCREVDVVIDRGIALDALARTLPYAATGRRANLFAENGIFLLRRG